ncbi:hypothetical protein CCACVL1_00971 [Corchorus capsularis]|uniref:Uncharacterized protein n=1 Tax=Corchorus capsularis TaxID=210143 RepID=A0A1R3KTL4_COCAP|nr:hypothetical protein CCACVL1_00971 [Corchorus capsularis]
MTNSLGSGSTPSHTSLNGFSAKHFTTGALRAHTPASAKSDDWWLTTVWITRTPCLLARQGRLWFRGRPERRPARIRGACSRRISFDESITRIAALVPKPMR